MSHEPGMMKSDSIILFSSLSNFLFFFLFLSLCLSISAFSALIHPKIHSSFSFIYLSIQLHFCSFSLKNILSSFTHTHIHTLILCLSSGDGSSVWPEPFKVINPLTFLFPSLLLSLSLSLSPSLHPSLSLSLLHSLSAAFID